MVKAKVCHGDIVGNITQINNRRTRLIEKTKIK